MDNNENQTITQEQLDQLSNDQLLELYCEQMLVDKGIDAEGEARDKMRQDLSDQLSIEINRAILAAMPDDKFDELDQEIGDGEDINMDLVAQKIEESDIDIDKITEETMTKFRELYLNGGAENPEA